MERAFSKSKFQDYTESLNTDDVLNVILKIEIAMKPYFNLKYNVFSNTIYFMWLRILKMCIPHQSQKEKQSGNNCDSRFNDFTDFESESSKIIFYQYFSG